MAELVHELGCTVIELGASYDSLDLDTLDDVGSLLLTQAATADPPRLVLDMSQTSFIGSTFIELLVRTWKRLTERGGAMVLCNVQPFCTEVFRVTQLESLWPAFPSRAQAVTAAGRK